MCVATYSSRRKLVCGVYVLFIPTGNIVHVTCMLHAIDNIHVLAYKFKHACYHVFVHACFM